MILFENGIIKLEYDPATDILVIDYPDLHGYQISEIKHSVDILADNVRNYDVKKVLLDSTKTVVTVTPEESKEIAVYMARALAKTRVKKLARLESLNSTVKARAKENIQHIQKAIALPFALQNFTEKTDALNWLQD